MELARRGWQAWRQRGQARLFRAFKRCDPAWRSVALEPGNGFGATAMLQPRSQPWEAAAGARPLDGVQLLTRFCGIEQPYWLGFLQHYQRLGVHCVHACVQIPEDQRLLEAIPAPAGMQVHVHLISGARCPEQLLPGFRLQALCESVPFTLLVDVDEQMALLNPGFSIQRLAGLHPQVGQFICPWLMAPQLECSEGAKAGFWGHVGKPLARSACIAAVQSDHAFQLGQHQQPPGYGSLPVGSYGLVIVHAWVRSFRDGLLKTLRSGFRDAKSCDQSEALALIRAGDLPVRLRLLAYLDCQQRYVTLPQPWTVRVDPELEEQLLRRWLTAAEERLCRDTFRRYREQLAGRLAQLPPYPALSLLKLAPLLPSARELLG